MSLSTLDIIFAVVLLVTLVLGLIKGLARQAVGLVAVIAGLLLAARWYPRAGVLVRKIVSNGVVADFIGFLALFAVVIAAGWLVGLLISKLMKGPLNFLDHVFGRGIRALQGSPYLRGHRVRPPRFRGAAGSAGGIDDWRRCAST